MYSFKTENEKDSKKAKGVPKCIVKKQFNFNMYKQTLYDENYNKQLVNFNAIRSIKHEIYTLNIIKCGLSNTNNKRYH